MKLGSRLNKREFYKHSKHSWTIKQKVNQIFILKLGNWSGLGTMLNSTSNSVFQCGPRDTVLKSGTIHS